MKQIFQYTIYPFVMLSAAFLIIYGIQSGYNFYWSTLPVITIFGVIILLLERWLPYEKDWVNGKGDWNLDLTYYVINYSIKLAAQFIFIALAANVQFLTLFPTSLPFWAQVVLSLTIIDFFLFLVHWQSHKYSFLWRLHAIHHSSERLYFLNGEKRHALHQILEGGPGILLCLFIGTPQAVIVTALAILAVNMFMQHTNLDYKSGILKKFFCVAELHRWHHRADYKDAQVNYGAWLTVWDRLFRTAYDKPDMQLNLGAIGIKEEPNFPKNYWKQFLYPFSKTVRQKAQTPLLLLLLLSSSFGVAQIPGDEILGNWQMQDGSMRIEVYKDGKSYSGKIFWLKDLSKKTDVGKKVLWNLTYETSSKEWSGGNIQLPDMDHSANAVIILKDKNTAEILGYHGLRLFGKKKKILRMPGHI